MQCGMNVNSVASSTGVCSFSLSTSFIQNEGNGWVSLILRDAIMYSTDTHSVAQEPHVTLQHATCGSSEHCSPMRHLPPVPVGLMVGSGSLLEKKSPLEDTAKLQAPLWFRSHARGGSKHGSKRGSLG